MSEEFESDSSPLVAVARAVRTRGLKGEVVADLLTDFPERFAGVSQLISVAPDGKRSVLELERHWFQKHRVILKFAGYDSIEAANVLVGLEFAVPEAERVELSADEFYEWELEGCSVEDTAGRKIGKVSRVLKTGGVDVLAIEDEAGREYLIPMAESIVTRIDIKKKRVEVDPPEGLLDL
jgi:16S rRNA processing protein RimM